ncbi:MAG: hypothetical protein PHN39_04220 [Candidatus Pacebacteria bacterium]|nr:hypothetical protein [Candidatus Paceibacterota bacterium]
MPFYQSHTYPQDRMNPGELADLIIIRLLENPDISMVDVASELQRTPKHIRKVYYQIRNNPKFYAVVGGHDFKVLSDVLCKRGNRIKNGHIKPAWRGKADWPAWKVATKIDVSGSEYDYLGRLTRNDKLAIYANRD